MRKQISFRRLRHRNRVVRWSWVIAMAALLLWPVCSHAQFAGPAPTKDDSPLPLPSPSAAQPASVSTPLAQTSRQVMDLHLHSGDSIEVSVFGVKDYDVKTRIDNNGSAFLPLIGGVHLDGLTLQQGQQRIAEMLDAAGMIRNPEVSILVTDSTQDIITISGEVNGPKGVPAFGEMRLLDVIASAGGLTHSASHTISILRPGVADPLLVQLGPNLANAKAEDVRVYPGDEIVVPRTGVVYVVGAVKSQSAYPLATGTPLTLMQVVTLAGGVNFEASKKRTRIIRTVGQTRQEIPVDLRKVMFGKIPDPVLQNDDIVFVPTNSFKAGVKGGAAGLALGLVYAVPLLPIP